MMCERDWQVNDVGWTGKLMMCERDWQVNDVLEELAS